MPGRALPDVDQAILVAVDERPQQHAADDAEDRGVGADAQGQRDDDRDGQALDSGERPQRKAEVRSGSSYSSHYALMVGSFVDVTLGN